MADTPFLKMHGLGNDFLVALGDAVAAVGDPARAAVELCDRRRGIGADGLLVGDVADGYAARMVLYNADGSIAEMSGNGIRCFAQAVATRHGSLDTQRILTDIFKSGGKSPAEMQDLLNRNQTTMGWLEYWSRQGFLREVVKGREKQYVLSRRALLELELDVA